MDPGALGQQPSLPGDFRPVRNPVTENKAPKEWSPELTSGFPMCTRPRTDTCAGGCHGSEVAVICTAPSCLKAGLVLSVGLGLGCVGGLGAIWQWTYGWHSCCGAFAWSLTSDQLWSLRKGCFQLLYLICRVELYNCGLWSTLGCGVQGRCPGLLCLPGLQS